MKTVLAIATSALSFNAYASLTCYSDWWSSYKYDYIENGAGTTFEVVTNRVFSFKEIMEENPRLYFTENGIFTFNEVMEEKPRLYFTENGNTRTGIDANGIHYTTTTEGNTKITRDDSGNILKAEYTFGSRRFGYDNEGNIWMENEHPAGNVFTGIHSHMGRYGYAIFPEYVGGFSGVQDRNVCLALYDVYNVPKAYQTRMDLTFITD